MTYSFIYIKKKKSTYKRKMSKILSMAWIMMMILTLIVIEGEAKSESECNVICRPHCKAFGSAGECSDCHKKCNQSPPSLMTKILKNQHNSKQDDLIK
ncbi:uncharacterized protein LOC125591390 [Brassica napus]|uniref:uncharacterized protein LOC125591390 n=1 Tax=Brassica napus TaxID=3708 RepID=UPI00207A23BF|nr:uncharacterized protein LOC125591390 [Brassica napus]